MKIGLAKSVHIMNKYTVQPMNVNMVCTTLLWLGRNTASVAARHQASFEAFNQGHSLEALKVPLAKTIPFWAREIDQGAKSTGATS
jgi:hypothetical protein